MKTKICSRCCYKKSINKFHKDKRCKDGYTNQCKQCHKECVTEEVRSLRYKIINHYSKGKVKCACCGEFHIEFLVIDHIKGGGRAQRKELGGTRNFYKWVIKNNYPRGFQILCHNCNCAKGFYGYCPHKRV